MLQIPKEDYQAFIDYVEFTLDFNDAENLTQEEIELYWKLTENAQINKDREEKYGGRML